jgi:predicted nucleic acid-binding Zn ribbon protein
MPPVDRGSKIYTSKENLFIMAKKSRKRKRSTSEKVMIVLGILIALSMMLSLIVGLGSSGSNAPLPESERYEMNYEDALEPLGALDAGAGSPIAAIPLGVAAGPIS